MNEKLKQAIEQAELSLKSGREMIFKANDRSHFDQIKIDGRNKYKELWKEFKEDFIIEESQLERIKNFEKIEKIAMENRYCNADVEFLEQIKAWDESKIPGNCVVQEYLKSRFNLS